MANAFIITGICLAAVTSARPMADGVSAHSAKPEKVSGYAEFKKGDTLIVDGQRVVSGPKARAVKDIPFGYEVTVTGRRDASGTVIADKVDARPNGQDDTEKQIIASTDKAEQTWVEKKMMFEPADSGKIIKIGDILESGPQVERARRIMIARSPTYRILLGVRGFQVDGKTDKAVALMKGARVYPLAKAANPPAMTFVNGSGQPIDTLFPDTDQYFDDVATIVETELAANFSTLDRFQLASIGIEQGKTFSPNAERSKLLHDAARFASAVARANSFANTDPERMVYQDRRWEWAFIGGSATWDSQGYVNTDRRAAFAYLAVGMSSAMVQKVVGQGSQYFTVYSDESGAHLDGGKSYHLHMHWSTR